MADHKHRGAAGVRLNAAHDARTRAKIQTSQLINRLTDHAFGKIDLQPTQIKSIEILLRKTMPDLSQISGSLNVNVSDPIELADADLAAIATGRSAALAVTADGEAQPDQVH